MVEEHLREGQVLDALACVREVAEVVCEAGFILACLARQRRGLLLLACVSGLLRLCNCLVLSVRPGLPLFRRSAASSFLPSAKRP